MAVKPGGGFARIARDAGAQQTPGARRYGIVKSIGDGTVDVTPDDKSGLKRKLPLRGGLPQVGDRIEIQSVGGVEVAQADVTQAAAARSAGLIVLGGASLSSSGVAYPLPHASTHATGGTDPLTPASIGAAVVADITSAMNTHLAAGDPHPAYLLASGTRSMSGLLTTNGIAFALANAYDVGSAAAPARRIYASEFDTSTLIAGAVQSIGGKIIVAKDTGVLPGQIVAADTTINFGKAMTPNDFLLFQGLGQVEYMQVGTLVSGTVYNVTRNLDGSGANAWPAGAVWVDLGYNGTGRIELDATVTPPEIAIKLAGTAYNGDRKALKISNDGMTLRALESGVMAARWTDDSAAEVGYLYHSAGIIYLGSVGLAGVNDYGTVVLAGVQRNTANKTYIQIDANNGVQIVGAGTGSTKLKVGSLTYPTADGTANQVLKTNGAGVLSWAAASATPAASTMPIADAGGKLAPAWMPAIGCRVIKSAAQTIPNTAWTPIQFDAEYFDTDVMHDNVTNNTRITIKTAGYYMVGGSVEWVSNVVGARLMQIWKNGSTVLTSAVHNSDQYGNAPGALSTVHYMAVNDYLELVVYQGSGGALNTVTLYDYSPVFWAMRVG